MKATKIICLALAGTLGFGSLASAQGIGHGPGRGDRVEQRHDRRDLRQDRHDHRASGHNPYPGVRVAPNYGVRQPHQMHPQPAPRYVHTPPRPHAQPRFHRGGYVPHEYRHSRYYVSDWRAYPGLYAPPAGHQWVHVDGEFLLVALATGLIANLIINGY